MSLKDNDSEGELMLQAGDQKTTTVSIFAPKDKVNDVNEVVDESKENEIRNRRAPSKNRASKTGKIMQFAKRRLQILNWIGGYNTEWALNDLIAGITLGLTIIPESIACALLAGLPAHYGLCSAFVGPFVYLIFGSIDRVIIGPTSLVALVSVQFTVGKPIELYFLLTFLSGILEVIMGCLQLGFVFDFISMPVVKAFSSATAILIIESQLKVLVGIKYVAKGMIESLIMLASRLGEASIGDLVMGIFAIVFLIIFDKLQCIAQRPDTSKVRRMVALYLSFSRNTLIVLITATISFVWLTLSNGPVPYALSRSAMSGLPNFTFPEIPLVTPERTYSFFDILRELNVGIIVIPIIGMLTNISIGRLDAKRSVDANQELLTVGLCNIFGACVQSMATSGAFSRFAISTACGLKTPMANLYMGIIVLLALSFLSPCFNYIPEPTLAAILMCSIFTLLDLKMPRRLWHESRRDFCIWLVCFIVCLICGVEVGLAVSITVTIFYLLFLWARPTIAIKIQEVDEMQYICVTPGNGIYFPAISYFREQVLKAAQQADTSIPVVLDCRKMTGLDYTAAQGISKLSADLNPPDAGQSSLLILRHMPLELQRCIELTENLVFCDCDDRLREYLTQESLRNGYITLKAHVRASIDLGYKVDIE